MLHQPLLIGALTPWLQAASLSAHLRPAATIAA